MTLKSHFLNICSVGTFALCLAGCLAGSPPARGQETAPRKKLIWHGWGGPSAKTVRENWRELDKLPLDGFSVTIPIDPLKPVTGDGSSQNRLSWNIFGPRPLQIESFKSSVEDLKSARWEHVSSLFIPASISAFAQDQGLSWFDDARWKTINNNWQVLFTVAKEGGCKGILFDPEAYDYGHLGAELFSYQNHRTKRVDKPFAEYCAVARRRGKELMQSVKDIYPDATLFCIFAYDLALYDTQLGKGGENGRYALLPSFLDGMMEGADARTKWLDGWEFAYGYKQRPQFLEGYHSIRGKAAAYAGNPALYGEKMRAGFGLMLDYNSSQKWSAEDTSRNHFSPAEWKNSVEQALRVSDEYVWLYTQSPNFFPLQNLPEAYLKATEDGRLAAQRPESVYMNAPIDNQKPVVKSEAPAVPQPIAVPKMAPVLPQLAGPNLLTDLGFEATRPLKDSTQPDGWFVQRWSAAAEDDDPALLNGSGVVNDRAHSGKNSYKFVVANQVYARFGANTVYRMGLLKSKNIPVAAGDKLGFSFWYYANDMKGTGDFSVLLHKTGTAEKVADPILPVSRVQFDATRAWRETGPDAQIVARENGWNKVDVWNISVPAGYKVAQIMLQIQGKTPGDYLYVDDLTLQR